MSKLIYGFIVDEALHNWGSKALLGTAIDQGAGYATENILEYFNEVSVIRDNRSSRFTYLGNGTTFYGSLGFLVDHLPPNSEGSTITEEGSGAVASAVLDYSSLSETDLSKLFNIIEDCLYSRGSDSSILTSSYLNTRFISSNTYSGYVAGSLDLSSNGTTETYLEDIAATASDEATVQAEYLNLPYWIKFDFQTENQGIVTLKLWLGRDSFLQDYPYSTIVDVVFPCEATKLAYPSLFDTPVNTLVASGSFINGIYNANLSSKEASGTKIYSSSYFPDTYSNVSMPFGILYKGVAPVADICKKAIRKALLTTTITEAIWELVFPELFAANKFFLIPIWDNQFAVSGSNIVSGITEWPHVPTKLKQIFSAYNTELLEAHLELILNDATNLIIAAIPAESNDMGKYLKTIHPSYVPVDATDTLWSYQDANTKTFNKYLGYAIADSVRGTIQHTEITEEMIECGTAENSIQRKFLYFSWNHIDYYLLDKASWAELA